MKFSIKFLQLSVIHNAKYINKIEKKKMLYVMHLPHPFINLFEAL